MPIVGCESTGQGARGQASRRSSHGLFRSCTLCVATLPLSAVPHWVAPLPCWLRVLAAEPVHGVAEGAEDGSRGAMGPSTGVMLVGAAQHEAVGVGPPDSAEGSV
jgi:hypothetical protein